MPTKDTKKWQKRIFSWIKADFPYGGKAGAISDAMVTRPLSNSTCVEVTLSTEVSSVISEINMGKPLTFPSPKNSHINLSPVVLGISLRSLGTDRRAISLIPSPPDTLIFPLPVLSMGFVSKFLTISELVPLIVPVHVIPSIHFRASGPSFLTNPCNSFSFSMRIFRKRQLAFFTSRKRSSNSQALESRRFLDIGRRVARTRLSTAP